MKKIVRCNLFTWLFAIVLVLSVIPQMRVEAASTYTVTFRAGNVGSFDTQKVNESVKNHNLVEVRAEYVKLKVGRGQSVQSAIYAAFGRAVNGTADLNALFLGFLKENAQYTLLDEASWGPKATDVVRHNEEYVLDYGVVVDPVSYTVNYVDVSSGEAVAAPVLSYGSEGDSVTLAPITVSEYESSEEPVTIVLSKEKENVVTFSYTYTGVTYVPGETTYRTEYEYVTNVVNVPVNNPPAGGNANVNANGNANANANQNANGNDGGNGANAGADGNADANAENGNGNNAPQNVIPDDDVPLTPGNDASMGELNEIKESEVPKAANEPAGLNTWMIGAIAGVVVLAVAVVLVTVHIRKKKKTADN